MCVIIKHCKSKTNILYEIKWTSKKNILYISHQPPTTKSISKPCVAKIVNSKKRKTQRAHFQFEKLEKREFLLGWTALVDLWLLCIFQFKIGFILMTNHFRVAERMFYFYCDVIFGAEKLIKSSSWNTAIHVRFYTIYTIWTIQFKQQHK